VCAVARSAVGQRPGFVPPLTITVRSALPYLYAWARERRFGEPTDLSALAELVRAVRASRVPEGPVESVPRTE
jgi:hypothetical protein